MLYNIIVLKSSTFFHYDYVIYVTMSITVSCNMWLVWHILCDSCDHDIILNFNCKYKRNKNEKKIVKEKIKLSLLFILLTVIYSCFF